MIEKMIDDITKHIGTKHFDLPEHMFRDGINNLVSLRQVVRVIVENMFDQDMPAEEILSILIGPDRP